MKCVKLWITCIVIIAVVALGFVGQTQACTAPPPKPVPKYWVIVHGDTDCDGLINVWIGIEIQVFAPPLGQTAFCACGLSLPFALGGGVHVDNVMVNLTNPETHEMIPIPAFDRLLPNAITSAQLNASFPGNNFFGFWGAIPGFTPPQPPPGFVYKLWFDLDVGVADINRLRTLPLNQS